jgi:quinone-modifying oxidoreductase subunit QmoB
MDKNYCAYICAGCGIGDALDLEALAEVVTGEMSMDCKTHDCLCGAEGRAFIEADINAGVNTVVVGACSPRVMTDEFKFGDDKITVRANLREQVVWAEV